MSRRHLRLVLALAGTLTGVVSLSACSSTYVDTTPPRSASAATGLGWQAIKPVSVHLPTDEPIRGAVEPDLTGPLIVNIWSSTCTPCKEELPLLQRIQSSGKLQVIGFTRDLKSDRAEEALDDAGVTYPNWMDTEATLALALDGRVPINAIPASVLIRDGKVVATHIGVFKSRQDVMKGLDLS